MNLTQELAERLRREIQKGSFDDRGRLPTQGEISETYGYSAGVVYRALDLLKKEGIIHASHAGTFLGPRPDFATGKEVWRLKCHKCPAVFEAPGTVNLVRLRSLLKENGWAWRGSARGWDYYCAQHNPWPEDAID